MAALRADLADAAKRKLIDPPRVGPALFERVGLLGTTSISNGRVR